MGLATEEVGASQVGSTVGMVKAARDLVLGQADAGEHIPPVLVPETSKHNFPKSYQKKLKP